MTVTVERLMTRTLPGLRLGSGPFRARAGLRVLPGWPGCAGFSDAQAEEADRAPASLARRLVHH
jgi:hypothetical protein